MFDTAAAGSASPLFIVGVGFAGLCLGLIADALVRRVLPQLAGEATTRLRITTAAVTFVLSALLAWRFGSAAELPAYVLLGIFAVPLARIDIEHHLLPNRLVGPLLGAGLALLAFASLAQGAVGDLIRGAAGSAILFVLYLILALTSRNGLGMGDVKLAAPLGLYLGYLGWAQVFYGGALAFVVGGLASVVLVLKNRGNKPKEVAYGPSMLAAGLAIILLLP
ncbi:leader peptidase (prepilin peptidase)/N-methyltransferase [Arthrobacter ginsengisoli]|uniref:Leader peptidase (Prepilin peptidase)/N-methyltransferase n=1 Tax=Arthrobacter ginsengisoli TaxID=1356565 RepID=A0ABU1UAM9_9MICC|nr:A24 family peptidase [Arthrobacter ginsengisoli]MDR7082231.1 leader peptidase (prepilin peptidase)/N-methyltransferase [Arthrobacter ginsengisoli]